MSYFEHSNSGPIKPGDRFKEWKPKTILVVGSIVMFLVTIIFSVIVKAASVGFFNIDNSMTGQTAPKYDPIHTLPYFLIGKQPLGLILLLFVILGIYTVYKLYKKAEEAQNAIIDDTTKVIKSDSNAYGTAWMMTDSEIEDHFDVGDLSETENVVLGQLPSDSEKE